MRRRNPPPCTPWHMPRLTHGPRLVSITCRQADVLAGICQGHSNAEIGARLFISEDTVKSHVKGLLRSLDATDRAHAAALAASGQVTVLVRVVGGDAGTRAAA